MMMMENNNNIGNHDEHHSNNKKKEYTSTSTWVRARDARIVRVSRSGGGKDRHSKVCTVRGLRDRRVRLSVATAIQVYDLQHRLGLDQPSKVIDWLLNAAKHEIDDLPPLPPLNLHSLLHHHQYHHLNNYSSSTQHHNHPPTPSTTTTTHQKEKDLHVILTTTTKTNNHHPTTHPAQDNSSSSSLFSFGFGPGFTMPISLLPAYHHSNFATSHHFPTNLDIQHHDHDHDVTRQMGNYLHHHENNNNNNNDGPPPSSSMGLGMGSSQSSSSLKPFGLTMISPPHHAFPTSN